jgi:DNA-binding SARP family transcriptional activator
MITCRTLGPVDVAVDGKPAPAALLWRKNFALLVYLARSPKRARTREHLVALLWPDKPQARARQSLREAIRALRRAAGEHVVQVRGDQVELTRGAVALDLDRFEELAASGDWSAAAALVGGGFLEGFALPDASGFEDWLAGERLAWGHRAVQALAKAAEASLARGDLAAATDLALRVTALDPLSELGVATTMRCLALSGDRAGALQHLERYELMVGEAGGPPPSTDLRALAERIRRERSLRIPEYLRAPAVTGAESRRAPLVGRAETLKRLTDRWRVVRDQGKCAVAIILGEPGTGKTRMLEEVTGRTRLEGGIVTHAIAVPADQSEPSAVLLGLAGGGLLDAPGVPSASPDAIRHLAKRLPEWAERFGFQALKEHVRPGRALSEVVRAAAQENPVIIAVDDAHWADAESLTALTGLARDLDRMPVLLLLAAAPYVPRGEIDELRSRIGRDVHGVAVTLNRLAVADVRTLARWAFPHYSNEALDRVTRRVFADSAGIPLLVVELLHAIAVGMELAGDAHTWPQPAKTLDQTLPGELPDPIIAATRVGFRRLSRDAQHTLSAIASLGDRVSVETLERATGLGGEALTGALDELEWQRWITAAGRTYGVVARITRDVILQDMLTPGQRERFLQALTAGTGEKQGE